MTKMTTIASEHADGIGVGRGSLMDWARDVTLVARRVPPRAWTGGRSRIVGAGPQKSLLLTLVSLCDEQGRTDRLELRAIAATLGYSLSTVSLALRALEAQGLVRREHGRWVIGSQESAM